MLAEDGRRGGQSPSFLSPTREKATVTFSFCVFASIQSNLQRFTRNWPATAQKRRVGGPYQYVA